MCPIMRSRLGRRLQRSLGLGALTAGLALAQPPTIKSIVESAAFTPAVSEGGLATIFGAALADESCAANSVPLPTMLCGTTVTVDGTAAPLMYVGPGQANLQLPEGTGGRQVVVHTARGDAALEVLVQAYAPQLFQVGNHVPAAVLGDYSLLGLKNPARSGAGNPRSVVSLYGTGLPLPDGHPPLGVPAPTDRVLPTTLPTLQLDGIAQPADAVLFAGAAPGSFGNQVNIRVPSTVRDGAHDLTLCYGTTCSAPVSLLVTTTGSYVTGRAEILDSNDYTLIKGTTNEKTFTLDAHGNFLVDASGTTSIALMGVPTLYNWRDTITVKGPTVLKEEPTTGLPYAVQLFPIATDANAMYDFHPELPVGSTNRPEMIVWVSGTHPMDLRDYLDWELCTDWKGHFLRIPDGKLPKTVYIPSGGPSFAFDAINTAAIEINQSAGKTIYVVQNGTPAPGELNAYAIKFQQPPVLGDGQFAPPTSVAGFGKEGVDYPYADILLGPNTTQSKQDLITASKHELTHGIAFVPHAPPVAGTDTDQYVMYFRGTGQVSKALENLAYRTAYWLRPELPTGLGSSGPSSTLLKNYDKLPQ